MTKHILAIHGAFSTPVIWNYFNRELTEYTWHFVDYSTKTQDINQVIAQIRSDYYGSTLAFDVIGHSMGGLIALSLEGESWVNSITTIATPLGGIDMNLLQVYFSRSGFLGEISNYSKFISLLHKTKYTKPIQHIITTSGFNPWMFEDNDGVVTLKSQRYWNIGKSIDIHANHSEVMMHNQTVSVLRNFLQNLNNA